MVPRAIGMPPRWQTAEVPTAADGERGVARQECADHLRLLPIDKSRDAIRKIFTEMEIQVARRCPADYFILQPPGLRFPKISRRYPQG